MTQGRTSQRLLRRGTAYWARGDVVELTLPMPVRLTVADERVDAIRGCVAVERGPLVYAVEQADQQPGIVVDDLQVDTGASPVAEYVPDLLGGVVVVRLQGKALEHSQGAMPYRACGSPHEPSGQTMEITAIPYFSWANRGVGPMRVWLPRQSAR